MSSETTWMIMSTLMLASASGPKIAAATPGLSATRRSVICASSRERAMPVTTCCSTISSSSQIRVPGSGVGGIVERRPHIELDPVNHRHFDRAHLQDLRAERGHFEHFLERDLVEPARLGNDARVGGVDAVDVGVDVAAVGLQRGGERHGGGVGAAATERGDAASSPRECPGSRRRRRSGPWRSRRRCRSRRCRRCAPRRGHRR